jgi:hypothetical protein
MSCSIKYNCCQQSGLCPENKICKPINSLAKPWKRFTCNYPDGYHGEDCKQPITSCQGYASGSRKLGMYKVVGSDKSVYEVYCHFDSDGAWTLVQSYSFANGSKFEGFQNPISGNHPVSENALTWNGYRLSKDRMKSIQSNSVFLRFMCDYEKHHDMNKSDYLQIALEVYILGYKKIINVLALTNGYTNIFTHHE